MAVLAALDVLNGVTNGIAAGLPEQGVFRAAGRTDQRRRQSASPGRRRLLARSSAPPFRSPHARPSWCWLILTAVATATTA
jgi:hypothetical protein